MKSENKEVVDLLLKLFMFIMAILGLLMMFLDFAKLGSEGYSGLAVTFGAKKSMHGSNVEFLGFSILEFIPFLCLVINAIMVFFMADGLLDKKIVVKGIVTALFLIATIMFSLAFLTPNVLVNSSAKFTIGIGAILAAIFSFLGALVGFISILKDNDSKAK